MYMFLNWIEKDGKIFFLTDKDILSPYGQEIFFEWEYYDILDHDGIRAYFNFEGGEEKSHSEFWNTKNFPSEIQICLKNFDKNFKYIFENFLKNFDLKNIIWCAPEEWKVKACKKLIPIANNYDLAIIVSFAPEKWKNKAWKKLKPIITGEDIRLIICFAPEKWKKEVWKKLGTVVADEWLYYIIENNPSKRWRKKAEKKLKENIKF